MALNTQSIKKYYCEVNSHEQKLLESVASPIVILSQLSSSFTSDMISTSNVAPGLNTLGFMLPHSPIYYLLFYYLLGKPADNTWLKQSYTLALVVTSANLAGGSIISDDDEALNVLTQVADIIVGYNRDIIVKCDDSVILSQDRQDVLIRRARGYVPKPYIFNYKLPQVLGLGAHLKNTFAGLIIGSLTTFKTASPVL